MVIGDLGYGGAQRVAATMANIFAETGIEVWLVTLADTDSAGAFELHSSVRRVSLGSPANSGSFFVGLFANLKRIAALRSVLRSAAPCSTISFIGPTNVVTLIASLGLPTYLAISERNNPGAQSFGRLWDWLRRRTYRWADRVTYNSASARETLAAYVPDAKLFFLRNPVPQAADPSLTKKNIVLSVGRLAPQKAHDTLLRAFARALQAQPGWVLKIAGEGAEREALVGLARALGITDHVIFLGVSRDIESLYREAAIFALASRFEGTPNAVLEAMANALPIVTTDGAGGALDFLEHPESALIVPVDNVEAFSASLLRLMTDASRRAEMGLAAMAALENLAQDQINEDWTVALNLARPPQTETGPNSSQETAHIGPPAI